MSNYRMPFAWSMRSTACIRTFIAGILFLMVAAVSDAAVGDVTKSGTTWTATVDGVEVYSGNDMIFAIQAAIDNLTAGRTVKETVNVWDSGDTGSHEWDGDLKVVSLHSYTILDFHGNTMNVNDTNDDLIVPVRARYATDSEIRNLTITGNPRYGIKIEGSERIDLSQIYISIPEASSIGEGIRIEERNGTLSRDISIDYVNVQDTKHHAVETYGVDGFTVGTVETSNTGGCGLLLNATANATIGTVDSYRADFGGGYAAFRIANGSGPNITVDEIIAVECGRGFFSVTESFDCTVNYVDISDSSSHGILLENSQGISVLGGIISNTGAEGVRIASRTDLQPSEDNYIENLVVSGCPYGVRETSPSDFNNILDNDLRNNDICLDIEGENTVVSGNICEDDGGGADPTTMHVANIDVSTVNAGQGNKKGEALVTILDDTGAAVSGATVTGTFTGDFDESVSADTDGTGVAVLTTTGTTKGGVSFTFCVDDVTGSLTYDSSQNTETCDSL